MVDLLSETDEPEEVELTLEVEVSELEPVGPVPPIEYTAIPATSATTTISPANVVAFGVNVEPEGSA